MKKWLPTIGIVAGGALSALTPQLQHLVALHPALDSVIVWGLAFLAHLTQSPINKG